MHLVQKSQKTMLICFLYMAVFTLPAVKGSRVVNELDPNVDMPGDLKDKLLELWCNGVNYTALCQGWAGLKLCLGEILPTEMWSIQNDTRLFEYQKEKLADLLIQLDCRKNVNHPPDVYHESSVQQWILITLGICCVFSSILAIIGYRYIRKSALYDDDKTEDDTSQNSIK